MKALMVSVLIIEIDKNANFWKNSREAVHIRGDGNEPTAKYSFYCEGNFGERL